MTDFERGLEAAAQKVKELWHHPYADELAAAIRALSPAQPQQNLVEITVLNSTVDGHDWHAEDLVERFAALDFSVELVSDDTYAEGCLKYVPCAMDDDSTCGHRVRSQFPHAEPMKVNGKWMWNVLAEDSVEGPPVDYRSEDCTQCGRMRVENNGICEKCGWDNDLRYWAGRPGVPVEPQPQIQRLIAEWERFYSALPDGEYEGLGELRLGFSLLKQSLAGVEPPAPKEDGR